MHIAAACIWKDFLPRTGRRIDCIFFGRQVFPDSLKIADRSHASRDGIHSCMAASIAVNVNDDSEASTNLNMNQAMSEGQFPHQPTVYILTPSCMP
jgi:hypothetical protein